MPIYERFARGTFWYLTHPYNGYERRQMVKVLREPIDNGDVMIVQVDVNNRDPFFVPLDILSDTKPPRDSEVVVAE